MYLFYEARMWIGTCKDEFCRQVLVFPECVPYLTCYQCGQTHRTEVLDNKVPFNSTLSKNPHILKTPTDKLNLPVRGPELIKVMGFSHYHQKLVSHLLTTYGMDKHSGKARLLRQITGRVILDCSVFGDRSFKIETRHLDLPGYGKDVSASEYLSETLKIILSNDTQNSLVPIHADGDGHCLVHAISRAVSGRELFWHPLRIGLKHHFSSNVEKYKSLLGNFINNSEWSNIIDECDPDYKPTDGSMVGLRNVHVFGLANLLRRPIILLDSNEGMKASADYAAVFLPGLNPPMTCCNKNGVLHTPLCLAWSSAARNHYIPLVPVKELPLPKLRRGYLPKVWGFPQDFMDTYMKFDDQSCVVLGCDDYLAQRYLNKLNDSMDEQFTINNRVAPVIVADLYHFHYSTKLVNQPKPESVIDVAVTMSQEGRLFRCIMCHALNVIPLTSHWLRPGGLLYSAAKKVYGYLRPDNDYAFRNYRITCRYDADHDILVVHKYDPSVPCAFCNSSSLRKVRNDGSVIYENGDNTLIPVSNVRRTNCPCGFKHWWDGNYYDNLPSMKEITFEWNHEFVTETFPWFSNETDPVLNSDVYELAAGVIQKHFPEDRSDSVMETVVSAVREVTKEPSNTVDDEEELERQELRSKTIIQSMGNGKRSPPVGNHSPTGNHSSIYFGDYEGESSTSFVRLPSPTPSALFDSLSATHSRIHDMVLEEEKINRFGGLKRIASMDLTKESSSTKRLAQSHRDHDSNSPGSPKPSTSRH